MSAWLKLASRVLVAGYRGAAPPGVLLDALSQGLAGVIFFARNLTDVETLAHDCAAIVEAAGEDRPPLRAIDQEGGRVARLRAPVITLPSMRAFGTLDDVDLTYRAGLCLGRQLTAIGLSIDLAPVLDVDSNPANPVIGDRAFSADPMAVIRHGLRFADGLHAGGCLSCAKHFPGHGDTDLDSHLALPRVRHGRERLERVELAPFRAASSVVPAIMTAHVVFDAVDPMTPATLSRSVVEGLLRGELGYEGVVVSDDLEMRALLDRASISDNAVAAVAAGCDLLLICSDLDACLEARDHLALHAERDPRFAARLAAAAGRVDRLRERSSKGPWPADERQGVFDDELARDLRSEIARRLGS